MFFCCDVKLKVYLSSDKPHPNTVTFFGKFIGNNISGLKTPEFPTSTHLLSPYCTNKV